MPVILKDFPNELPPPAASPDAGISAAWALFMENYPNADPDESSVGLPPAPPLIEKLVPNEEEGYGWFV